MRVQVPLKLESGTTNLYCDVPEIPILNTGIWRSLWLVKKPNVPTNGGLPDLSNGAGSWLPLDLGSSLSFRTAA